ncbi:MAG: membrane dipeptidase [Ignavibacteriae bacterium]|nr:membrane dipeptidase [Ignavibacteriota bacterium]
MNTFSRREFLRFGVLSAAGIVATGYTGTLAGCASSCPDVIAPPTHRRRVLADLHVHPMMNTWLRRTPLAVSNPLLADIAENVFNTTGMTWKTCFEAGIDVLCAAHFNVFDEWLSMPTDPNPEAPANTLRMIELLEEELTKPENAAYAKLARNRIELREILSHRKGDPRYRIAVIHALEGGHALGGRIESLDQFAKRGVALITLTHFFNKGIASAPNAYPFFPDAGSRWPAQGLSEFGASVIRKMEELGIVVDVTHSTSTAINEILCVSTKPVITTHASARTLGDHPYSLYDEQIQEIAKRGGIVGIILYPYILSNFRGEEAAKEHGSLRDVVRTIRYTYKICGTHKHIGIGSDFSGYIVGPRDMKCLGEIDKLRRMLLDEFDQDEQIVEDMMANNVIGFLNDYWRSGQV